MKTYRVSVSRDSLVNAEQGVLGWRFLGHSEGFDGNARVFGLFTDIEHAAERVSGIKEIEVLTTGTFQLGTRWRETRDVLGRLDDAEMEVTAFELNRQYTVTHYKVGVRLDTVFTFEPMPGGARVSIEFGLNSWGLPPGLLSPLEWALAGQVRDVLGQDLSDLKAWIEKLVER